MGNDPTAIIEAGYLVAFQFFCIAFVLYWGFEIFAFMWKMFRAPSDNH